MHQRIELATLACIENQNKNCKRQRCGEDVNLETDLKKRFVAVGDKNAPINGTMLNERGKFRRKMR